MLIIIRSHRSLTKTKIDVPENEKRFVVLHVVVVVSEPHARNGNLFGFFSWSHDEMERIRVGKNNGVNVERSIYFLWQAISNVVFGLYKCD